MWNVKSNQPLRPAQFVKKTLITAILEGTYASGTSLPNERSLAEQMGVTRPTLRETLQRLAAEGWITIQHGKPTVVNDYWREGGLRLLGTLSKYRDYLPAGFISHLLQVRLTILPAIAGLAVRFRPDSMLHYLADAHALAENAQAFADYDWNLQMLMARNSQNPVFSLILNDFSGIFAGMAVRYFCRSEARWASRNFYGELTNAIENGNDPVEDIVRRAMAQSIAIWHEVKAAER